MKIVVRMAARDMLPEWLNDVAAKQGRPSGYPENAEVHLKLEVPWTAVPRKAEEVFVHPEADPKHVEHIWWNVDGSVDVFVEDLDTDEVAGEEGVVFEELFSAGWEIDWEMTGRPT